METFMWWTFFIIATGFTGKAVHWWFTYVFQFASNSHLRGALEYVTVMITFLLAGIPAGYLFAEIMIWLLLTYS